MIADAARGTKAPVPLLMIGRAGGLRAPADGILGVRDIGAVLAEALSVSDGRVAAERPPLRIAVLLPELIRGRRVRGGGLLFGLRVFLDPGQH